MSDQNNERPVERDPRTTTNPQIEERNGPSGHNCTSSCGNDYDCPACEHGYREDLEEVCPICDGE